MIDNNTVQASWIVNFLNNQFNAIEVESFFMKSFT